MKNALKLFCLCAIAAFTFTSCSTDPCGSDKDDFLDKFDTLVEKLEKIDYETTHSDWEAYNQDFKKMIGECYEIHQDDMSSREERRFIKKTAVYYVKTFSGQVDFEQQAAEIGKLIDDNLEGVSGELSKVLKDVDLNINIDEAELEELFGELGDDIEKMGKKWGKKLEKILEKE